MTSSSTEEREREREGGGGEERAEHANINKEDDEEEHGQDDDNNKREQNKETKKQSRQFKDEEKEEEEEEEEAVEEEEEEDVDKRCVCRRRETCSSADTESPAHRHVQGRRTSGVRADRTLRRADRDILFTPEEQKHNTFVSRTTKSMNSWRYQGQKHQVIKHSPNTDRC